MASMGVGRRLALRDRAWLPVETIRVLGPMEPVSAAAIRAALAALYAEHPTHKLICRLDRRTGRWLPLPEDRFGAFCAGQVIEVEPELGIGLGAGSGAGSGGGSGGGPDPAADAVMRRLIDVPLGEHPMIMATGGAYLGVKISHAVGDARVLGAWSAELMYAAANGVPPRAPIMGSSRWPLARAALRRFGKAPGDIARAFRVSRPPARQGPDPAAGRPWRPDPDYRYARVDPATLERLRQWRDAEAPGVSVAAMFLAAVSAALTRAGVGPPPEGLVVLVDARRYLPPGVVVDGNFCWGQYLRPADQTDPRAVQEALLGDLATGRPLAMLILRHASLLLRRRDRHRPATTVAAGVRPELTVSNSGRLDVYDRLPWSGGLPTRSSMTLATPAGPAAITVSVEEMAGMLHATAVFHRSTFDPDAVGRAIDLIGADLVGLLSAPRGVPRVP